MPKWIASLVGRFLKSKVKLEDGPMDGTKKWYQSRTIWTGIVAVVLAAYSTAATQFGLPTVPEWVYAILGSFGVYTRVTATDKIS
jgi:hypothetical protein